MGKGSSEATVGYEYRVGLHFNICHGPWDKLLQIRIDKKQVYLGDIGEGPITIDKPDLFGGAAREGGVSGTIDILSGKPNQTKNAYLLGVIGPLLSAYRGFGGLVARQFYVGNNPYLKPWDFLVQRIHLREDGVAQWYDAKAAILSPDSACAHTEDPPSIAEDFVRTSGANIGTVHVGGTSEGFPSTTVENVTLQTALGIVLDRANAFYNSLQPPVPQSNARMGGFYSNGSISIFTDDFTGGRSVAEWHWDGINRNGNDNGTTGSGANTGAFVSSIPGYTPQPTDGNVTLPVALTRALNAANMYYNTHGELQGDPVLDEDYHTHPNDPVFISTNDTSDGHSGDATRNHRIGTWTWDGVNRNVHSNCVEFFDMNPAHIIRECLTNEAWGMGYSESDMGDSFTACADTLYAEQFGISLEWKDSNSVEDFVKDVLRYIDGVVQVDRTTGKFELKLIRDDYDASTLLVLDPSNVDTVSDYTFQKFGELTSSVSVEFWSNQDLDKKTITVTDGALAVAQQADIVENKKYPGITNLPLANRIAARDLRVLSTPIRSCTVYATRVARNLKLGEVFKLTWPDFGQGDDGVQNLIMRVVGISYGDGKSNRIKIQCTEDIFGITDDSLTTNVVAGGWVDPRTPPGTGTNIIAFEVPYLEAVQRGRQSETDALDPMAGFVGIASSPAPRAINARLYTESGAGYQNVAGVDFCPSANLNAAITELQTSFVVKNENDFDDLTANTWFQVDDEILNFLSYDPTTHTVIVGRGLLDTVPAKHATDALLMFWDFDNGVDPTEYATGETVHLKLLNINGSGTSGLVAAHEFTVMVQGRIARPYPPGNFKINGQYFPAVISGDILLTWTHRDRKQQTSGNYVAFPDANIGPETGVTYSVQIFDNDTDDLLFTIDNITATTYRKTASTDLTFHLRIELFSKRDGLESYQRQVCICSYTYAPSTGGGDDDGDDADSIWFLDYTTNPNGAYSRLQEAKYEPTAKLMIGLAPTLGFRSSVSKIGNAVAVTDAVTGAILRTFRPSDSPNFNSLHLDFAGHIFVTTDRQIIKLAIADLSIVDFVTTSFPPTSMVLRGNELWCVYLYAIYKFNKDDLSVPPVMYSLQIFTRHIDFDAVNDRFFISEWATTTVVNSTTGEHLSGTMQMFDASTTPPTYMKTFTPGLATVKQDNSPPGPITAHDTPLGAKVLDNMLFVIGQVDLSIFDIAAGTLLHTISGGLPTTSGGVYGFQNGESAFGRYLDRVAVANTNKNKVQFFDNTGALVETWKHRGVVISGSFEFPLGVTPPSDFVPGIFIGDNEPYDPVPEQIFTVSRKYVKNAVVPVGTDTFDPQEIGGGTLSNMSRTVSGGFAGLRAHYRSLTPKKFFCVELHVDAGGVTRVGMGTAGRSGNYSEATPLDFTSAGFNQTCYYDAAGNYQMNYGLSGSVATYGPGDAIGIVMGLVGTDPDGTSANVLAQFLKNGVPVGGFGVMQYYSGPPWRVYVRGNATVQTDLASMQYASAYQTAADTMLDTDAPANLVGWPLPIASPPAPPPPAPPPPSAGPVALTSGTTVNWETGTVDFYIVVPSGITTINVNTTHTLNAGTVYTLYKLGSQASLSNFDNYFVVPGSNNIDVTGAPGTYYFNFYEGPSTGNAGTLQVTLS